MSEHPAGVPAHPTTYHAPPRLLPSAWACHVAVQLTTINGRLHTAMAGQDDPPAEVRAAARAVADHLNNAGKAITHRHLGPARVVDWWRGASVEQAFLSLHAARVALIDLLPERDVRALEPDAVARAGACLYPTDPRRLAIENLQHEHHSPRHRSVLRHALEMGYAVSDQAHAACGPCATCSSWRPC